ncbi:MAG: HDOD domain-containing protein [Gammaproteobacteria bacterium]|nr:HDOD domain-containing protein [Gammaproteobacteria bacterium]
MGQELSKDQIEEVLKGITIPPQPQIIVDVQMEQAMPNPDIDMIADLISKDIGISGKILKTVNSPFFGLRNRIASIKQAVTLLGIDSVINLMNAMSMHDKMLDSQGMSDEAFSFMSRFWDTAADIAMASSSIAKQIGFQSPDEAYSMGLFHNSGVPLLMQRFSQYDINMIKESYNGEEDRVIDVENKHLDTNHAVLGYYIAKSWRLPLPVCEAIARHHDVRRIFSNPDSYDSELVNLLAILKMAEHIVRYYSVIGGQDVDHEWDSIKDDLLMYVGFSEYDFDDLTSSCHDMGLGA